MRHFQTRDLEQDDSVLTLDEKKRLVVHLGNQCEECWRAVGRLTCRDPRSLVDPVQRALHRTRSRNRLELDSGHLRCLREVRTRPLGFAELVLREAHSTLSVQGWSLAHDLVEHIFQVESGPDIHDLAATRELLRAKRYLKAPMFADLSASSVKKALALAGKHYIQGNRSPLLEAEILLWRRSHRLPHQKKRDQEILCRALVILKSADPLLRFELAEEIAMRRIQGAASEGWPRAQRALELAFSQTRDLPRHDRLHGLYLKGRMASTTAAFLILDDQELFEVFEPLSRELEAALPDVQRLGDSESEVWFCYWIGNLRWDSQVLTWWFRALRKLAECGSEKFFLRIASRTGLLRRWVPVAERRIFLREAQALARLAFGPGMTVREIGGLLKRLSTGAGPNQPSAKENRRYH